MEPPHREIQLIRSLVTSIFLYACESGTLTAELQRRIRAVEMRCYTSYCASYTKITLPTRKCAPRSSRQSDHKDLLTIVKRPKLKWYEHVSHSSGLGKTILQVKGGRRQGRQKKRLENNIREWTGPEFTKSQSEVENREKWRKLVVKSSVVPQRPSRLKL